MFQDVNTFTVTIPAGGSATAPQIFNLPMLPREVNQLEIVIPDGNRGVLNFALGAAGTRFIPSNAGAYIIGNDEVIKWPLEGYINSGAWQLFAFNTGTLSHLLHLRFLMRLLGAATLAAGSLLIPSELLAPTAVGGGGGIVGLPGPSPIVPPIVTPPGGGALLPPVGGVVGAIGVRVDEPFGWIGGGITLRLTGLTPFAHVVIKLGDRTIGELDAIASGREGALRFIPPDMTPGTYPLTVTDAAGRHGSIPFEIRRGP